MYSPANCFKAISPLSQYSFKFYILEFLKYQAILMNPFILKKEERRDDDILHTSSDFVNFQTSFWDDSLRLTTMLGHRMTGCLQVSSHQFFQSPTENYLNFFFEMNYLKFPSESSANCQTVLCGDLYQRQGQRLSHLSMQSFY